MYIGDVAFATRDEWEACKARAGDGWDETECYFVYDELKKFFPALQFEPMSSCAGLFTLKKLIDKIGWRRFPRLPEKRRLFFIEKEYGSLFIPSYEKARERTDQPAVILQHGRKIPPGLDTHFL